MHFYNFQTKQCVNHDCYGTKLSFMLDCWELPLGFIFSAWNLIVIWPTKGNCSFGRFFCLLFKSIYFNMVAQTVKHLPAMREIWVWSLGWESPLEKEMAIHSSTLAWKIPRMEEPGRLQATVHGVSKSRTRRSNFSSLYFTSILLTAPYTVTVNLIICRLKRRKCDFFLPVISFNM